MAAGLRKPLMCALVFANAAHAFSSLHVVVRGGHCAVASRRCCGREVVRMGRMQKKAWKKKQRRQRQPGPAADVSAANFAGISEDHNHEQFFYDDTTNRRLFEFLDRFDLPLLLCNPSLAVLAEEAKRPYLLLDRDRRFRFLPGFREFSLTAPFLVDAPYDAIFLDPPFANISPAQLVRCLRLMAPSHAQASVPLFLAYNSEREEVLLKAFEEYPGPALQRSSPLSYRSVRMETQSKIFLYAPRDPFPNPTSNKLEQQTSRAVATATVTNTKYMHK